MAVASVIAVPALSCIGVTPGRCLSDSAAAAISSQLVGCQSSGRPTCLNSFLLKNSTRPSVPCGMPYRLPSYVLTCWTAFGIWFQPSQASTLSLPTISSSGWIWPPCANSPSQMPSISTMSPPMSVPKSSAILALYSSSSTPTPSNLTWTLTPLSFCSLVNRGMTQSSIHLAPSSFLPPLTEFDVIVSSTSLASALRLLSDSCSWPRQPDSTSVVDTAAATSTLRRIFGTSSRRRASMGRTHQPRSE